MLGQELRVHLSPCTRAQMNTPFLGHVRPMLGFHVGHRHSPFEAIWPEKNPTFFWFRWEFFGNHVGAMLGLCVTHVGRMLVHVGQGEAVLGLCWAYVGPTLGQVGPLLVHVGPKNLPKCAQKKTRKIITKIRRFFYRTQGAPT